MGLFEYAPAGLGWCSFKGRNGFLEGNRFDLVLFVSTSSVLRPRSDASRAPSVIARRGFIPRRGNLAEQERGPLLPANEFGAVESKLSSPINFDQNGRPWLN